MLTSILVTASELAGSGRTSAETGTEDLDESRHCGCAHGDHFSNRCYM